MSPYTEHRQEARRWLTLCTEKGHPECQYQLAEFLAGDVYSDEDPLAGDAMGWYRRAANQGQIAAPFHLAAILRGREAEFSDPVEPLKWAILFDVWAGRCPGADGGRTYSDSIREGMTATEIDEAERLAREWRREVP